MNNIEILAPAGGYDSVIAAVRSGADAVYIGAKAFSARASAHNFDEEEMRGCVRYCHQRGVKVYLALNTVIFDDEMPAAFDLAIRAARADIDAIIIQDMGLVSLIRAAIPDLPLHASTQMTVHTPYGAKALYELGFKRVVVSRELSLEEICAIRDFCPEVELEVFVHGALCMCVSGQCYFSAMLGGRSANRGMCAQPCRLPMRCGENDHALSLKDNGSLGWLRELEAIGVASAKIEGRMKRPEYVAAATAAAKEARDNGYVSTESEERLRSVFSRTGFTDGYLSGRRGAEMFGYRRRDDVVSADSALLKEIRNQYKDECQTVKVAMTFSVKVGEPPTLTVSDCHRTVTVSGSLPAEQAVNVPLTEERARQNLTKTGGTPYFVGSFDAEIGEGAALSAAALNALRREALDQLDEQRAVRHHYTINEIQIDSFLRNDAKIVENRVCITTLPYPEEMDGMGRVYAALEALCPPCEGRGDRSRWEGSAEPLRARETRAHLPLAGEAGCPVNTASLPGIEYPRVSFGNEAEIYEKLRRLKEAGVSHLIAHNIAALYIGRELGYTVHAGFGLNLVNSWALSWAKDYGVVDAELSPEIDLKRVEALHKTIPVGIIRYGYLPLMITRNAPAGMQDDCKNPAFLQDRKNERFSIIRHEGYSEIMNCVPVLMPQKDYKTGEGVFNVFRFSVENSVEKMKKSLEKLRENPSFERFTHGLYLRGVK